MRKLRVSGDPHSYTTLGDCFKGFCARVLPNHKYLSIILLIFFSLAGCACRAETATPKNVLVLFSSFASNNSDLLSDIEPAIRARVPGQITFYDAYLEHSRIEQKSYRESQAETFRNTYDGVKFSPYSGSFSARATNFTAA